MRILHVVPSYIPAWRYGGPIRSVHGLCKALAARGHDIAVATTNVDGDGNSEVPLGTAVDLEGVKVHYFPSTRLRRLYYSPPMYRFMKATVATCDLVHTHSVFLWPTTAAARLARAQGRPYVISPRGMLVKDLIARRSSLLKRGWIGLFERRNVNEAAAIHVTSALEGAEMLALGLKPRRIVDVPNGWDEPADDVAQGAETPLPKLPGEYVLFLGRISWKKGLDRLVAAIARVPGLHLVVAGNDEEDYWPSIVRTTETLGITDRVHSLGYVHGASKERLLSGALLLALPSYSENFGNVVLEAMARRVPVVVTREVGLAAVVEAARAGLVSEGAPESIAAAISLIRNDALLRTELASNGEALAREYSWERIAQRIETHYDEIVRSHGRRDS